VIEYFNLIG